MSKAMEELVQEEIRVEKIKTVMKINKFGKSSVDKVKEIVELSDAISM